MTRKDYEVLVGAFHNALGQVTVTETMNSEVARGFQLTLNSVMDALATDNPRFNRDAFLTAITRQCATDCEV